MGKPKKEDEKKNKKLTSLELETEKLQINYDTRDAIDIFPHYCTGQIKLCPDKVCTGLTLDTKHLLMQNKFGNIYVNIIPTNSNVIDVEKANIFYNKDLYGEKRNNV